jgi:hypothetical protein
MVVMKLHKKKVVSNQKQTILCFLFSLLILFSSLFSGCVDEDDCINDNSLTVIDYRSFNMGFSTWSFGPSEEDKLATYGFIADHADIYVEKIDDHIPWKAWMDNASLPQTFTDDISYRVSQKLSDQKLLLSLSLLNTDRSDLLDDYDGFVPSYESFADEMIEDAYFKHVSYLIDAFNPDYIVLAMEVNELLLSSESKWDEYKQLMESIRARVSQRYPQLLLSESVTLHNWFNPEVPDSDSYLQEISDYVNQFDFVSVSFYPFLKGLKNKNMFQQAFDFLHDQVYRPIAIVETAHIAEWLIIPSLGVLIDGDVCQQQYYLESLLVNAYNYQYEFIIWWSFRDFDKLWETFPPQYRDIGKIWRDTGLIDEQGKQRPAYSIWTEVFSIDQG